ncbi:MAG TPA: glycosyltransferase [Opitutaceae bacterium]|nr:glycosyltransferase [Opitutaceae bacterium]
MKRVLIVSPHFPPINAPDMQRVRMSLPYYLQNGWEPVVLAVGPQWQDAVSEPELLATLPPGGRIEYVRAIPPQLARRFGIGNLGLRSWPHLLRRGSGLLAREKFDLVFFSNTQFVTFALGPFWRKRFGVPYVIDIQDPWRTDYYERPGSRRPPGGWKYQFARLQARALEGPTFLRAAGVMSVSPSYLEDLRARYAGFADIPQDVIRFGASRQDLEAARRISLPAHSFQRKPGEVHLLYTGASGPVMPHALTVLFTGLRQFRERYPDAARRLRLHFIGTSYVAPGRGKPSVLPVAELCEVADMIDEVPHRVGHLEALRLQLEADALLLPGSSDLAYSPSKVYPYYLTGKPMLGLVFRDSVMERLLDELGCAYLVRFRLNEPKDDAHAGLHRFLQLALDGFPPGSLPQRNDERFNQLYLVDELTRRQCALFERALAQAR